MEKEIHFSSGTRGPIANFYYGNGKPRNTKVSNFIEGNTWNIEALQEVVPNHVVQKLLTVHIGNRLIKDQGIWSLRTNDNFSCSSAFQYLRRRNTESPDLANVWVKQVPFKMSLIAWRMIKKRLPLDDIIQRFKLNIVSRCT